MIRVLQVTPEIGPGTGVGSVAYYLEREWQACGIPTERFTMREARGSWLPQPGPGVGGRLAVVVRVVWFSTVGSVLARRAARRCPPDTIVVCHNDALAGDVYINHGIVVQAMRNRGHAVSRILRNPLHPFIIARDLVRYRSRRIHRLVVNLTTVDEAALRSTYGSIGPQSVVIGNGVDLDVWSMPTDEERLEARGRLGLAPDDSMVLFVGHEFGRKGLPELIDAVAALPDAHLMVVGGTVDLIAAQERMPSAQAMGARLHFLGAQPDPRGAFIAADVFCLPSAYESYGLVVLEALACGVPVVGTRTGCLPDVVVDGVNGALVERTAADVRAGLERVLAGDRAAIRAASRAAAAAHSWSGVAQQYLDAFRALAAGARQ